MSGGPYLYDDDPAPLHTGTPRRRQGLVVGIVVGTAALAIAMVVALPLVRGTAEEQSTEVVGVFLAALQAGDSETAHQLLCEAERRRLTEPEVAGEYLRPGSGRVEGSTRAEVDGERVQRVEVTWTQGGTSELIVVNEDGPHVCGAAGGR